MKVLAMLDISLIKSLQTSAVLQLIKLMDMRLFYTVFKELLPTEQY